jgi:hypothetical protein
MSATTRQILNFFLLTFWILNTLLLDFVDTLLGIECNPDDRLEAIIDCDILFGDPLMPGILTSLESPPARQRTSNITMARRVPGNLPSHYPDPDYLGPDTFFERQALTIGLS